MPQRLSPLPDRCPLESLQVSEYPARRLVCGELARGEELELRLDDGRSVLLLFNSSPLRDATGAVIGAISTVIDISTSTEPEPSSKPRRLDHAQPRCPSMSCGSTAGDQRITHRGHFRCALPCALPRPRLHAGCRSRDHCRADHRSRLLAESSLIDEHVECARSPETRAGDAHSATDPGRTSPRPGARPATADRTALYALPFPTWR